MAILGPAWAYRSFRAIFGDFIVQVGYLRPDGRLVDKKEYDR
jgi:hypothetical protein